MTPTPERTPGTPHTPNAPTRRRALTAIAGALAAIALGQAVHAQAPTPASGQPQAQAPAWPTKPVRFVVNLPAGGPLYLAARVLAERVSAAVGQPVVVDNRPGAGGNIGAEAVARAPADGHTVLISIDTPFTVNPAIYPKMPFGAAELRPLVLLGTSGMMLAVPASERASTLAELVAKARTTELSFCSAGNGSPGHLASAILADTSGARIVHVPYKGNAPAVTALIGAEVEAGILATPGLLPQVQAGKLKALAVTGRQRSPLIPQVPTTAEAGMPALEMEVLYLALVPAGVPGPIAARLQQEIGAALATRDVQERLRKLDLQPSGDTGPAVQERVSRLQERYAPLIRRIGLKVE